MDSGYVTLELDQLILAYPQSPDCDENGDLSVRIDLELLNHAEVFKWASSSNSKCSTSVYKAVKQVQSEQSQAKDSQEDAPPLPPTTFILGFPGLQLKTDYIDLNVEVMSALCNVVLVVKISSIASGKEEVLAELSLPLFALLTAPGAFISATSLFTDLSTPLSLTVSMGSALGSGSSLTWRVCCDNDMAEYCVGSSVLQVETAALMAPPATWGLQYADVIDPKAKVRRASCVVYAHSYCHAVCYI